MFRGEEAWLSSQISHWKALAGFSDERKKLKRKKEKKIKNGSM